MFGTGVSPGLRRVCWPSCRRSICDRVDKVTIERETADTTFYDSPATEIPVGFGKPIDHPDLAGHDGAGHRSLRRGRPDGRRRARGRARRGASARPSTPRPPRISTWARGPSRRDVSPVLLASWKGSVGDKVVVELNVRWRKGQTLDPDWKIDQDGWVIQIDGRPTVTAQRSDFFRRPTSRPRRSPISWCSDTS